MKQGITITSENLETVFRSAVKKLQEARKRGGLLGVCPICLDEGVVYIRRIKEYKKPACGRGKKVEYTDRRDLGWFEVCECRKRTGKRGRPRKG